MSIDSEKEPRGSELSAQFDNDDIYIYIYMYIYIYIGYFFRNVDTFMGVPLCNGFSFHKLTIPDNIFLEYPTYQSMFISKLKLILQRPLMEDSNHVLTGMVN